MLDEEDFNVSKLDYVMGLHNAFIGLIMDP
jgi:hypothetical protein